MEGQQFDWQVVVDRAPTGYVEINDGETCVHGPIKDIGVNKHDNVIIDLEWAAKVKLGEFGVPLGGWEVSDVTQFTFPNLLAPFVIEDTPHKGERVRWGVGSLIYFDEVEGIDPTTVKGLKL